MISKDGTDGIAHTIHIANVKDGELTDFTEYENVLDVMNLPNGSVKFYFEGEEKIIRNGRIVRSTVRGIEESYRYRCSNCNDSSSDLISQKDRGKTLSMNCSCCEKETEHQRQNIDDI